MELQQLKYFKTVAEKQKISDAAEALFISAPALSVSISRLEKELGVKLFDRMRNRVQLNEQGKILLQYVNQVFSTLDCARAAIQHSINAGKQTVSIATISSVPWGNLASSFSMDYPQFDVSWNSMTISQLSEGGLPKQHRFLLAAEDDLPNSYSSEMDSAFLFEEGMTLVAHKDSPLAAKASVTIPELENEVLFLPMKDYSTYNRLQKMFEAYGLSMSSSNSHYPSAAHALVAAQKGYAFACTRLPRREDLPLCYIPIEDPCGPWITRLYWRKNTPLSDTDLIFKEYAEVFYRSSNSPL